MLLTKLAHSSKATFWSQHLKGPSKEVLIASEAFNTMSPATILDVLVKGPSGYLTGAIELRDEGVKELLDENGLEMETVEEACATFANILVDSCSEQGFKFREDDDYLHISLRHKVERMTLEIEVPFKKSIVYECPPDFVRLFQLFSREARKESAKKRGASQGSSQMTSSASVSTTQTLAHIDGTEGSQTSPTRSSKLVVKVNEKKKKKLKV